MELVKQYIIQCIVTASNNLRLSSEKIEVVAMLKDVIIKSENLENDIKQMKKITEFSRLAIKLNEIYNFLTQGHVNFLKVTDKFKEHCQYLIKEISYMLDMVNPATFKKSIDKLYYPVPESIPKEDAPIDVDLSKRSSMQSEAFEKPETEKIKEKLIFEEEKEDEEFFKQNFEASILKPIKKLDGFLKLIVNGDAEKEEMSAYANLMKYNGEQSRKIGFGIIADMHEIFAKGLLLFKSKDLLPAPEIIEAMRACLIVIVAVVRNKDVDINQYLNRAEEFGRKIHSLKIKE
jgi:hypothetical protein